MSLAANHEEYRNDDESPATEWLPGCDRMVILTHRYDDATLLDYRDGPEPKVVLADLGNEPETRIRATFDSFDAFFMALRAEREDEPDSKAPSDLLSSQGLDLNRPDAFWGWHAGAAQRRATVNELDTGAFELPEALRAFYQAADGGHVAFAFCPHPEDAEFSPIPGKRLLPYGQCVSLAELSDRLEFSANARAWRELWPEPERLLVLSARFDSALLLFEANGGGSAMEKMHEILVLEGTPGGRMVVLDYRDAFRTKGGDGSALVIFEGNREHRRYERAALVFANLRAKRDALL
ncbi:MAG: hypothetical protein AAF605_06640 [Myxococcota bacterium]